MEEKNLYMIVEDIAKVVSALDKRVSNQEQIILQSFSYLYNKQAAENSNTSNFSYIIKDITSDFSKQLTNIYNSIEQNKQSISQINVELESLKNIKPTQIPEKKRKRKRPWYWIFIKKREYNKLLEKKRLLEEDIDRRNKQRLKEIEEEKKKQEALLAEKRKKEEERRKIRRANSQKEIANILARINNKKGED